MRNTLASMMTMTFTLIVMCGCSCGVGRVAHASDAVSTKEEVGIWAVCPHLWEGVYSYDPDYVRPQGVYLLRGTKKDGVLDIHDCEGRSFFSENQLGEWIGHTAGSRYLVLYGVWDWGSGYGYTVFDKVNPLDPRFAPADVSSFQNFGWIDSRWQVISLGIRSEEELRTGARRHVLVFDPETLTTSKLGLEAWRHVLREQGLEVRDGRLVYRPLFNLPFEGDIPKDLMIEGKSFKIHWNDSHRTVLMTSMVGDASRLILMIIDKATRESVMKEYRRTGTFQVRWPWAIWAATEHGRVPSAEEPFFMVRDWHVENLENGQSGEFTLEVQSDNRGIDMLDDVFLWGIGEELWAVDLREAVEKGTTKPQRVWKDPLVPAIQALFYAQDDGGPESSEKQQADMSSEEQEVQDGTEN